MSAGWAGLGWLELLKRSTRLGLLVLVCAQAAMVAPLAAGPARRLVVESQAAAVVPAQRLCKNMPRSLPRLLAGAVMVLRNTQL